MSGDTACEVGWMTWARARLGSARLGSARLGFDSAWLGSAQPASARLVSARLGSARYFEVFAPQAASPENYRA